MNEKLTSFISGVVHALSFYGAVPKYLVPDNLKSAISKHSKDELVLNSVFSDLEDFYDTVVLPPPPRKPKGKPTVENHVRYLETHLIEKLKGNAPYSSIEALNMETERIIADINQRNFRNQRDIRKSRQHAFEIYDKPRMKALPTGHFTVCDYKYFLRVPDNYHLEYDGHYYSVAYTMHGMPALLKATMSEIRICDENNRLLCTHVRSYKDFPRYITDDAHMPPEHRYYKELNAHDGAYYRRWATVYGQTQTTCHFLPRTAMQIFGIIKVLSSINIPVWIAPFQRVKPFGKPRFTLVDFLTATNKTDDGSPIGSAVHCAN